MAVTVGQVSSALREFLPAETISLARASGTSRLSSWRVSHSARLILDLLAGWAVLCEDARWKGGVSPGYWDKEDHVLGYVGTLCTFDGVFLHTDSSYSPFLCGLDAFQGSCEPKWPPHLTPGEGQRGKLCPLPLLTSTFPPFLLKIKLFIHLPWQLPSQGHSSPCLTSPLLPLFSW